VNAESTYRSNAGYLICFIWLWECPRDVLKENVGVHGIMQRAVTVHYRPLRFLGSEDGAERVDIGFMWYGDPGFEAASFNSCRRNWRFGMPTTFLVWSIHTERVDNSPRFVNEYNAL